MSTEHYTIENLITDLQEIFSDPANDLKVDQAKSKLTRWLQASGSDEGKIIVDKADLEKWVTTIKELKQFKADAENDIGEVIQAFATVLNEMNGTDLISITKMATKIISGKVKVIDPERLKEIGKKYAPITSEKLLTEKTN